MTLAAVSALAAFGPRAAWADGTPVTTDGQLTYTGRLAYGTLPWMPAWLEHISPTTKEQDLSRPRFISDEAAQDFETGLALVTEATLRTVPLPSAQGVVLFPFAKIGDLLKTARFASIH